MRARTRRVAWALRRTARSLPEIHGQESAGNPWPVVTTRARAPLLDLPDPQGTEKPQKVDTLSSLFKQGQRRAVEPHQKVSARCAYVRRGSRIGIQAIPQQDVARMHGDAL